jgi:hypothetical protein
MGAAGEIVRCLKRYLAREIYRHIAQSTLVITPKSRATVPVKPR